MIGKIKGFVEGYFEDSLLIDVNGICYNIFVDRKTLFKVCQSSDLVELFIETLVRETGTTLFGFLSFKEQVWFRHLLKLNGVSGKIAIAIMSNFDPESLALTIATKDEKMISTVPGIGKKLAARIITELEGIEQKIANESLAYQPVKFLKKSYEADFNQNDQTIIEPLVNNKNEVSYSIMQDAINALCSLGFMRQNAYIVVQKITKNNSNIELADLVKQAIKQMGIKD